jgi:disulfide bond formation protein DsbB
MSGPGRHEILAPAVAFAIGLATILGAWGFELIGGFIPCELCLQERLPYYIGVPFALVALLAAVSGAKPTIPRFFLMIAGIVFAYGIYLGVYHAGAEWAFWPGPTNGSGGTSLPTTTEDLMKSLSHARVVSCTEPAFRFPSAPWGLSLAGANALISLFLAACAFWGAFRPLAPEAEGAVVEQN